MLQQTFFASDVIIKFKEVHFTGFILPPRFCRLLITYEVILLKDFQCRSFWVCSE